MRSDSHPFQPNSLVYGLTVHGHSCDCGAYWRDCGCPLGSLEALALGAHIERLKELVSLEICELPKFGRVNPLPPRCMRRNQSRGYTNANEKWRFLCCIDSLALYLVK